ncbi:MAG: hypothetical protein DRJ67_05160 [Thermoprotei archaeon]|nr:MAG: hypothetical protein DRJ67_05160 [Thermoprotei archaeon]
MEEYFKKKREMVMAFLSEYNDLFARHAAKLKELIDIINSAEREEARAVMLSITIEALVARVKVRVPYVISTLATNMVNAIMIANEISEMGRIAMLSHPEAERILREWREKTKEEMQSNN